MIEKIHNKFHWINYAGFENLNTTNLNPAENATGYYGKFVFVWVVFGKPPVPSYLLSTQAKQDLTLQI